MSDTKVCSECNVKKDYLEFNLNGRNGYRNKRCKQCVKSLKAGIPIIKLKTCKACLIERPINNFEKSKDWSDGYQSRCKICKKNGTKIVFASDGKWAKKRNIKTNYRGLVITNPMKQDYIDTFMFLRDAGYNLKEDIHIQFCEKYGLTPNSPKKVFKKTYSQKDCGLV
jgi:hypothetical protein